MAIQTITLKIQKLDVFGPSPSTKWSSYKWTAAGVGPGNGTWGMKSAACQGTSSIQKNLFRKWTGVSTLGISCPAASVSKQINKNLKTNSNFTVLFSNTDEELYDAKGYSYLFPLPTSNAVSQNVEVYTSGAVAASTYTSLTASITTWS